MNMNICTVCKKKFIPGAEHLYKTKQGRQCSYTCWNRAKARQESIAMHAKIMKNKEETRMNFKENEIVIHQNGGSFEVGKIKRLCDDGAFVWYHSGDTAAYTPYESIYKIKNAAYITGLMTEAEREQLKQSIAYAKDKLSKGYQG